MKKIIVLIIAGISSVMMYGCSCKHEWKDATCVEPKTCTSCGITEGEALGHEWNDATCTEPQNCGRCGETEGDALGHLWQEATCIVSKTCLSCGITEGESLGHNWQEASCTEPKTCLVCKITEGDVLHAWSDATCIEPKICSMCGITEGTALGHNMDGEKCSNCGYVDINIAVENAKNTIYIYGIDLDMNSVGGVDTYITWKNVSHKEIKYIHFYVQYYNRVKDVLKDEIDDSTTQILSSTGPFPYGKGNYEAYAYSVLGGSAESLYFTIQSGYKDDKENGWADRYWEAPFYNSTTKYVKLTSVDIEYMDGTTYIISEEEAIAEIIGSGNHPNAWSTDDTGDDYLR